MRITRSNERCRLLLLLLSLVPSAEITGGPWYNEQEFDHVFIDTLSTFVYEVIKASVRLCVAALV